MKPMLCRSALTMIFVFVVFAASPNAPGDLDLSFDSDGIVTISIGSGDERASGVAIQQDGKVIVAGRTTNGSQFDIALARFNIDGSLDQSFDMDGKVVTPITTTANDYAHAVAVQQDGKIVAAGYANNNDGPTTFVVIRYNTDGSLDPSFDFDGIVITSIGLTSGAKAATIQPDGKIVVAGWTATGQDDFAIARYNTDGSLDTSFDVDGVVITSIGNFDGINAVAIQSDGKIVVAGYTQTNIRAFALARYNTNGSLDTSFDVDGNATTPIGIDSIANAVTIQPNGKIVVTGYASFGGTTAPPDFALVRYNANGSVDTSFGTEGTVITPISNNDSDLALAAAIQFNGKIVVVGLTQATNTNLALARYDPNGSLDSSFDGDGIVKTPIVGGGGVNAIAIQSDGKIIAAGMGSDGVEGDILVARYIGDPVKRPFDFDGDGKTDIGIFRPAVGEWWINRSSNATTFALQFGASTDKITPGDFTGDGKTDIAFWRPSNGNWFILRSEDFSFFAFPFGTTGDIPAPADYDGDGKADAAVFRPSNSTWYILRSGDGGVTFAQFGIAGDVPVTADYDGDGKSDIAIFRPGAGEWWIQRSSNGQVFATQFGSSTDRAVPGDYTGDGKADVAFWRPSNGNWFILRSEDFSFFAFPFGISTDIPVPGDYDGDGRFDAGVFRPSDTNWYINRSTAGVLIQQFGLTTDQPIPSAFVP